MKVVYIDILFVSNLMINYLLLLLTARFSGVYVKRWRLLVGAALGAVFAVLLYFPSLPAIGALLVKVLLCAAISALTFSREKNLFRISAIFVAVSFAFAGGIMAMSTMSGNLALNNGVPYFSISFRFLLAATVIVYGILRLVFGNGNLRINRKTSEIQLCDKGRTLHIKGLRDSGNLLRDPISGRPVMILSASQARILFEPAEAEIIGGMTRENLLDRFALLAQMRGGVFRIIPYKTAAEPSAMLLTVKIETIMVDGKDCGEYLIGITPVEIETGDGCRAILGV